LTETPKKKKPLLPGQEAYACKVATSSGAHSDIALLMKNNLFGLTEELSSTGLKYADVMDDSTTMSKNAYYEAQNEKGSREKYLP